MEEPSVKKRKVLDETDSKINEILHNMRVSTENLNPVISDELINDCSTIDVYVGKVLSPKFISEVILKLNDKFPIVDLSYLKRAKATDILIAPATLNEEKLKSELQKECLDQYFNFNEDFKVVSVVSKQPLTKKQYDTARKLWPCNFHPDKYLEKLISCNFFTSDEVIQHRFYMNLAYEVGLITESSEKEVKKISGVVVVDPKINSIVAMGYDERKINPSKHPIMVAIDNVAKSQNGGAWEIPLNLRDTDENVCNDGLDHRGIPSKLENMLKQKYPIAKFGATPSKMKNDVETKDEVCGPYLCTDYYVYSTNEACIMCAMALIHSRVKRVFFGMPNTINGGIMSKCKIHTLSALNHHYEVFTGFFS